MKRIMVISGARPNFMKIAPLMHEFRKHKRSFNVVLVHTGQHYDYHMSEVFFQNLSIPEPDFHLNVGSGSHAVQTAKIMAAFEKKAIKEKPDLIIVVGDVNSTLACSIVAAKLNVKIAHVEAGLRSFDRSMPEEINRIVTDSLADLLLVSEESGLRNLKKEGVDPGKICFVGNTMIDTLLTHMKIIDKSKILDSLQLKKINYCVMTLHRPINVDSEKALGEVFDILEAVAARIRIVYPIHPRTKKMIRMHGFLRKFKGLKNLFMIEPLGYVDFIKLAKNSLFVLTDSGGIQEETTVLKIPCLTMRENTERPSTIREGTNYLVGRNKNKIIGYVNRILNGKSKKGAIPEFWDGKAAKRIVDIIAGQL